MFGRTTQVWSGVFRDMNRYCALLSQGFDDIVKGSRTFEQVRDNYEFLNLLKNCSLYDQGKWQFVIN